MPRARTASSDAREQRRVTIGEMVKAGYSQREMAQHLKVGLASINRDLQALRQGWRDAQLIADPDEAMSLDLVRLDDALKAITPAYRRGDLHAVDRMMAIVRERRAILGYGTSANPDKSKETQPVDGASDKITDLRSRRLNRAANLD